MIALRFFRLLSIFISFSPVLRGGGERSTVAKFSTRLEGHGVSAGVRRGEVGDGPLAAGAAERGDPLHDGVL